MKQNPPGTHQPRVGACIGAVASMDGWGIDGRGQRRPQSGLRVNQSSLGADGIFGGGAYAAQAKGDPFLAKLEAAEIRDAGYSQAYGMGHRPISAVMFGDDSRPDAKAPLTTNQIQQMQAQKSHKEALQRAEEKKLMEIMMDEMGMTIDEAKREIALYRREQAMKDAPPPPQPRPEARPQTRAQAEAPFHMMGQGHPGGGAPLRGAGHRPMLQPPGGSSSIIFDDGSHEEPGFQEAWEQRQKRRGGKGGPRAPLSDPSLIRNGYAPGGPEPLAAGASRSTINRHKSISMSQAVYADELPHRRTDPNFSSVPGGIFAAGSGGQGVHAGVGGRYIDHIAHGGYDGYGNRTPPPPPQEQPRLRRGYGEANVSSVPGGIFAHGVHS